MKIQAIFEKGGFEYSILRVGNIIGAREANAKQWAAQLWLHGHRELGMPMHLTSSSRITFSYNYDIAQAVSKLLAARDRDPDSVVGEAYNIGCSESFTQYEYFREIGEAIGITRVHHTEPLKPGENATGLVKFYPENADGFLINTDKAIHYLRFRPTNLAKAVRETALFYERSMVSEVFITQRRSVLRTMTSLMRSDELAKFVTKKFDYQVHGKQIYQYEVDDYEEELADKLGRLEL